MKQQITYDLHEMRSNNGKASWISTKHYNLPYSMIKGLKAKQEALKHVPGTFFLAIKNGLNPIEVLLKRKKSYEQTKMVL